MEITIMQRRRPVFESAQQTQAGVKPSAPLLRFPKAAAALIATQQNQQSMRRRALVSE